MSTRQRSQFLDYSVRFGQQHRVTSGRVTLTQFFLDKFKHIFKSPVNSCLALLDTTESPPNTYKPCTVSDKHVSVFTFHLTAITSPTKERQNNIHCLHSAEARKIVNITTK